MEFLSAASSSLVDFLPGSNKFTFEMAFEICKALEDDIKSKSVCTSTFDWNEISQTVNRKFKLTPIQCCQIWKYLAYGKWLEEENAAENSDDEEPYYQPYEAIIRYKINRPLGESSSECQSESNLAPKLINTNIPAKAFVSKNMFNGVCLLAPDTYSYIEDIAVNCSGALHEYSINQIVTSQMENSKTKKRKLNFPLLNSNITKPLSAKPFDLLKPKNPLSIKSVNTKDKNTAPALSSTGLLTEVKLETKSET